MDAEYAVARFRQQYGERYAEFLVADWGPPPHLCPLCRTPSLHKLVIGDDSKKIGESISAKWYLWCQSCRRGIYCPPGTYTVRAGKPYIPIGDREAIERALPSDLKLISPVPPIAPTDAET
jgi:hypothetical protein